MGTLNRSSFMAMAAAALGIGGLAGLAHAGAPTAMAYHGVGRHRSRIPGKPKPAGAKLARLAAKQRVGIAVIR